MPSPSTRPGGRLSDVLRPRTALIALAAVALSGCATFDNTDVVASVGDAELSQSELERRAQAIDEFQLLQQQGGASSINDNRVTGDLARFAISSWIGLQLAEEADIVGAYLQGPVESGITCVFAIPAPDAPTADGWVERLQGGETWTDLLAEVAPEAQAQGRIECLPTQTIADVADQMADMTVDDPYRSLVFADGSVVVVRMQALDDIDGFQLISSALTVEPTSIEAIFAEIENLDIDVAPRYGTFDPDTITVQPLG